MNSPYPFIWFKNEAEEAANFYIDLFPNSKINSVVRYPQAAEEVSGQKAGSVMTVSLELDGTHYTFLNGGKNPGYNLPNGSISFVITCETQDEIDKYWNAFADGGQPSQCGWIQDRYGVTWQVVPSVLQKLLGSSDQQVVERVTACFMKMTKFDIAQLEAAAKA